MNDQTTTANWSRRVIAVAVGIALVLFGAAGGIALARSSSPENAPTAVDIGFNQDMSVHHLQAVQMANLVPSRSDDTDVHQIAFDIGSTLARAGRPDEGLAQHVGRARTGARRPADDMDER